MIRPDHPAASESLRALVEAGQLSRRQLLRRATALGLSAPVVASLLLACGGEDEEAAPTATRATGAAPTVIATQPAAGASTSTTSGATPVPAIATPGATQAAQKPAGRNQTLIFVSSSEFRTLDPAGATESGSTEITHNSYEGLVSILPRSADIAPRLAKSWQIAEGAQEITFQLQQGVKFHDGTMMDAEAVKLSFQRCLDMQLGNAAAIGDIDTIETPDQFTVKFTLKRPNAYFVENCTQIGIISPTAWQKNDKGGDFGAAWLEEGNTAGTGPYRLTEYRKNESKTAERFADYWRGWSGNHLEKIIWPIVPQQTTRRQMLEKGEAHIVRGLPIDDVRALESNPSIKVEYIRAFILWTMPMVMFKPPQDNLKVRQALQYAFDYETYLKNVWLGHGTVGNGPTPPGLAGYTADSPVMKYDLEKARQLLAESGVENVVLEQYYIDTSEEEKQSAVLLQDALKQLGVELKLQAMPWSTMFNLVANRDTAPHQTNLQIGPTRPDPAFTMEWTYGSHLGGKPYNWSYYNNPKVDDLIARARASADREQGRKFLEEANRLIIADAPTIWYTQPDRYDTISAKIQNWSPLVVGYPGEIDYYEIYLSD